MQLKEQLRWAVAQLTPSTTESPRLDAELLLCHLLGKSRSWLHTWPDQPLTAALEPLFRQLVERRRSGEPIAHLLGSQSFWSLDLKVTADTLIPRPDTERLIEQALLFIPEHQPWQVADLGTGTGAIAIAIAAEMGCDADDDWTYDVVAAGNYFKVSIADEDGEFVAFLTY